jgi:UDP-N-acetylglucosamine acyltransferase
MGLVDIHHTAIVDKDVQLDEGVKIGPYCIIGKGVKLGKGTELQSNIVIEKTEIGQNCKVFPFTSIGLPPQDTKYTDQETTVKIGDNNIIREYITIHRASVDGDYVTHIGDNNFLMAYVHIAHNCKVGNMVTMANCATLAGHVELGDYTIVGGLVAIHQFTRIGSYAMVGGFSGIGMDVPPYMMASGSRASLYGLNVIGLKRRGFSEELINDLKECYKILYKSNLTLVDALKTISEQIRPSQEVKHLIEFIEKNKRGIMRPS